MPRSHRNTQSVCRSPLIRRVARSAFGSLVLLSSVAALRAEPLWLTSSAPGRVLDRAQLFEKADLDKAEATLRGLSAPVWVVTIPGLVPQSAEPDDGWTIDAYARGLLAEWTRALSFEEQSRSLVADGAENLPGVPANEQETTPEKTAGVTDWSRAVLCVISKQDERVGIATGTEWLDLSARERDVARAFGWHLARGHHQKGLSKGVEALERFVRREKVPVPGGGVQLILLILLFALTVWTVVDGLRKGSSGLAYRTWSAIFSGIGTVLTYVFSRGAQWASGRSRKTADEERAVIGGW